MLAMLPAMSRGHRRPKVAIVESGSFAAPDWSHSFEDGTFGVLANFTPSDVVIATDQAFEGTKSCRIHYVIDAASGDRDRNRSADFEAVFQSAPFNTLDHFFVRWYLRFGTPLTSGSMQRKTIYIKGDAANNADWQVVLSTRDYNATMVMTGSEDGIDHDLGIIFAKNTWYGVEIEVQLNTPAASDGAIRSWVYSAAGATLVSNAWTSLDIRGTSTRHLEDILFGEQVDRADSPTDGADEYRWLDKLALSRTRIGA